MSQRQRETRRIRVEFALMHCRLPVHVQKSMGSSMVMMWQAVSAFTLLTSAASVEALEVGYVADNRAHDNGATSALALVPSATTRLSLRANHEW